MNRVKSKEIAISNKDIQVLHSFAFKKIAADVIHSKRPRKAIEMWKPIIQANESGDMKKLHKAMMAYIKWFNTVK